jgi:hypothetical protein
MAEKSSFGFGRSRFKDSLSEAQGRGAAGTGLLDEIVKVV